MCVCVCVCVIERQREYASVCVCACARLCVCERERERERDCIGFEDMTEECSLLLACQNASWKDMLMHGYVALLCSLVTTMY